MCLKRYRLLPRTDRILESYHETYLPPDFSSTQRPLEYYKQPYST